MKIKNNGFASAIDADSDGVEGKYYVWEKKEIDEALGSSSEEFCKIYNRSKVIYEDNRKINSSMY